MVDKDKAISNDNGCASETKGKEPGTKKITHTNLFINMPFSAQCLYFHLSMEADQTHFVEKQAINQLLDVSVNDFKLLIARAFIVPFDTGFLVIKDWKLHSYIHQEQPYKNHFNNSKPIATKTPQQETPHTNKLIESPAFFFENNGFGTLSPHIREQMNYIYEDFFAIGAKEEDISQLIIKALQKAITYNARNWKYAEKVLISWSNKGYKTVFEVDAADKSFEASKQRNNQAMLNQTFTKEHDLILTDEEITESEAFMQELL